MKIQIKYILAYLLIGIITRPCGITFASSAEVNSQQQLSSSEHDEETLSDDQQEKTRVINIQNSHNKTNAKQLAQLLEDILTKLKSSKKNELINSKKLATLVNKHELLQKVCQSTLGGKRIKREDKYKLIKLFAKTCDTKILHKQINSNDYKTTPFLKLRNQKWTKGCLLLLRYQLISYGDCLVLGDYYHWDSKNSKKGKVAQRRLFDKKFYLGENKKLDEKAILGGFTLLTKHVASVQSKRDCSRISSALASMVDYAIRNKLFHKKIFEDTSNSIKKLWEQLKALEFTSNEDDNKEHTDSDSSNDEEDNPQQELGESLKNIEKNLLKIAKIPLKNKGIVAVKEPNEEVITDVN
ncbi:MAG: hypothetical protein AAF770_00265 [Bacteroidota bacterium]